MSGPVDLARAALVRVELAWRQDRRFLLTAVLVASTPGLLAVAFLPPDAARAPAIISAFVTLYLQLLATARTLHLLAAMPASYHPEQATERRFPSAVLGSLLYLLATTAGLVLLVVPGVAIFLLWSLWMPAMLAERLSVSQALRRSFAIARPRLAALGMAALGSVAGLLAALVPPIGIVLLGYLLDWPPWVDRAADAAAEVTISAFLVGNAVFWASIFSEARGFCGARGSRTA